MCFENITKVPVVGINQVTAGQTTAVPSQQQCRCICQDVEAQKSLYLNSSHFYDWKRCYCYINCVILDAKEQITYIKKNLEHFRTIFHNYYCLTLAASVNCSCAISRIIVI